MSSHVFMIYLVPDIYNQLGSAIINKEDQEYHKDLGTDTRNVYKHFVDVTCTAAR